MSNRIIELKDNYHFLSAYEFLSKYAKEHNLRTTNFGRHLGASYLNSEALEIYLHPEMVEVFAEKEDTIDNLEKELGKLMPVN